MGRIIFTGIRPSGRFHIGNLSGMFYPLIKNKDPNDLWVFMIADLHAGMDLKVDQDAILFKARELMSICENLNHSNFKIFVQSENYNHLRLF